MSEAETRAELIDPAQQPDNLIARKYWNKLKQRLGAEDSQLVTDCHQLKMTAADGKQRPTDVATAETLLRLVQSRRPPLFSSAHVTDAA